MINLKDLFSKYKNGAVKIEYLVKGISIGGGTGFLVSDWLITNHHVYVRSLQNTDGLVIKVRRQDGFNYRECLFSPAEIRSMFVRGSEEEKNDYAILSTKAYEIFKDAPRFTLTSTDDITEGTHIAFMGFPFKKDFITCHSGYISSLYEKNGVSILQIDGSINSGNSGGPLINLENGNVIGIVTRAETGFLVSNFQNLEKSLAQNVDVLSRVQANISVGGVSIMEALTKSQKIMLEISSTIKKTANVGIGYAFSIAPILKEIQDLPLPKDAAQETGKMIGARPADLQNGSSEMGSGLTFGHLI